MKIIHFSSYSIESGGPSKVVFDYTVAQSKAGHEVTVVAINKKGQTVYNQIPEITYLILTESIWGKILPFFSWKLWGIMQRNKYDVFHVHALWNYPTLLIFLKKLGKSAVFTIHGTLRPYTFRNRERKRAVFSWIFQQSTLKKAAIVHGFSVDEKKDIEKYLNSINNVTIIPNGVSGLDYELEEKKVFKGRFLFMSRLDPIKGLDLLLPAFQEALKICPNYTLTIAGPDYGMQLFVERFIEDNNLAHAIRFVGSLSGDDKKRAFNDHDVFVLTSYSEGFSIAVLEALQHGLPVLVSTEVGFPEVIANTQAGYVANLTVAGICKAFLKFENSKSIYQTQSINAKALINTTFNINEINRKIMDLYEELMEKKNS